MQKDASIAVETGHYYDYYGEMDARLPMTTVERILAEGEARGEAKGEKRGIDIGIQVIKLALQNKPTSVIVEQTGASIEEVQQIIDKWNT